MGSTPQFKFTHSTPGRFVVAALVFYFFLSPLQFVFAQDVAVDPVQTTDSSSTPPPDASTPAPQDQTPAPADEGPATAAAPTPPTDDTTSDTAASTGADTPADTAGTSPVDTPPDTPTKTPPPSAPQPSSFGDGSPTVQNPNLFTYQSITPNANGETGALTQNIKLDIPPGRSGLQPDLSLQYNSQRTEDGIVGYGWSISIPHIERLNKTGSQDLYGSNAHFTSSMDGELATSSNATTSIPYVPTIEQGAFNSYSYSTASSTWTVFDKNGTRYLFGASEQSRMNAASGSPQISRWMLEEMRDSNNNYVRYTYSKDNNQIYPSQIVYTGNASTDGPFTILFTTASRPDAYISYKSGFKVTTNYRISKITASISGSTVKEYNLSYTSGANGLRSLLSSLQENGYDQNHTLIAYPAISFGYIASTTATFYVPGATRVWNAAYIVSDVQGNALNDVSVFYEQSQLIHENIYPDNSGTVINNFTPPDYWASQCNCTGYSYEPVERGVRFVDVNADGKTDIVRGYYDYSLSTTTITSLSLNTYSTSTGYAWSGSGSGGTIPIFGANLGPIDPGRTTGLFGDVNGDGLPDYELRLDGSVFSSNAYLGNGSAWDATTTIFSPVFSMPNSIPTQTNSQLVDINGDGLDDWVYSDSSNTYVRLNTGTGWESVPDSHWTLATTTLYYSPGTNPAVYYDRGIRFFDINGDGLPDMIHSYTMPSYSSATAPPAEVGTYSEVSLNTGSGWATPTAYALPAYITTGIVVSGIWEGTYNFNEYANWTGNGQNAQDVLSTITYPQGGTATVTYSKSAQSGANPELPISLLTVSSIITNDGLGDTSEKDYSYSGGKMYLTRGVRDRKVAGFYTSTETSPSTVTRTYFDQGDNANTGDGEQNDGWGQISHVFRQDVLDPANGNLLVKRTFSRWDTATTSAGTFVFRARQVTQDFASDGAHRDTATDYSYSTTTGNVTQITRYGEVNASSDGTFSDTGSDKSTENISYSVSTTTQVTGLPYLDSLLDQSNTKVKETRNYYDSLALGSTTIGNLTKQESWITGTTYASTTKAYNSYGLVATSTDPLSNKTTYVYDAYNLYQATTTNPLSQKVQNLYDYSTGKPTQTVDQNNATTSTTYDGLGRPLTLSEPDPSTGSSATKTTYAYTDSNTAGSTSVLKTDYLNAATSTPTYSYLDGLGRNLQQRTQAQGTNTYAVKDWTYNNLGLLNSESLLYFASSTARTTATSTAALFSTYSYDPLQRVSKITNAVGSTTNAYKNWTVTTTDANGKVKDYTKDAYGNLASVVEHVGGTYATTTYAWDLNGSLTKLTDASGNVRNFTYDGLGRRLTAEDLHASGDGTFGSWTYSYDPASNLTQKVDPKSQTINLTYDALNRPLTEDYTGQAGTEVTYLYDSCANGKGRLCSATTTNNSMSIGTWKTYNPLGLVATDTKQIVAQTYNTHYTYDRQGNQTDILYPDSSEVLYTYDSTAQPIIVQQREATSSPWRMIISNINYSPLGQETSVIWGSGATTTNTYDPNQLYRLTHKVTILPDEGDWGTGASGDSMGFITSNSSNASWTSANTPPYVSTNLNTENYWFTNSISYQDSFENGTSSWVVYNGAASATSTVDCTTSFSGSCSLKTVVASTSWQSIPDLIQILRIDPNVNYTLKFRMKASTSTSFEADIQQNHDLYTILGLDVLPTVTTSWKEYSYYFSSTATTTDKNARLIFALGQKKSATYWIDDVELVPDALSTVQNPSSENISDPTGNNYGYSFWVSGGSSEATGATDCTTPTTDGACSANINVLQATSTDWFVQWYEKQALATSTTYILTFDAKSTYQRDADVVLQQNHSPNNTFTPFTHFTVTPNWNHYVIELTPTGGDVNGRFDFNLGTAAGHIWFDNLRFFKKQNTKLTAPPPHFTGIYDTAGTTTASAYQVQVVQRGGNWASPLWDSGKTTLSPQTQVGARTATSTYAGPTLPSDGTDAQKYFWRMMTWDQNNNASPWTNGDDFFFTPGNRVQDLSYTYDAVGNITHLVDASFTKTAKVVDYSYDDLNRLTQASTTPDIASGAPNAGRNMAERWTYDALGNILTDATSTLNGTFATTTYTYSATGDANPDAATQVGSTTLTYDNDGNQLTGYGVTKTWDWRNHLNTTAGATSTTYSYDFEDNRARVSSDGVTTHYPNSLYQVANDTFLPVKHLFVNGDTIADITGATGSGVINYDFVDHLGSTEVTADPNNRVQEVTDYASYGALNNHDQLAGFPGVLGDWSHARWEECAHKSTDAY
jgi:YD repeat-containing protein